MSICWKCGKEFVNENNLGTILCYDCASKIPMTTASSQIDNFDIKNDEISEEISEKEKFIEFCEIFGFKVSDTQMKVFELYNQSKQENKQMFINLGRQQGQNYLNTILINFELWKKDQRIAELERELKKEQEKHCDACYCDLKKENEQLKQQLKNMESDHELLINDFEEETKRLQKEIKHESDARKRFVIEVAKLKQQLAEKDKLLENAIVPVLKNFIDKYLNFIEIGVDPLCKCYFCIVHDIAGKEIANKTGYDINKVFFEAIKEAEEALKKLNKE